MNPASFHVQGFRWESSHLLLLPHSDVLYPKNTCSPHSGVPAEVLCRGRDFVVRCCCYTCCAFTYLIIEAPWSSLVFRSVFFFLWCICSCLQMWRFTQERSVMRKEVASIIKVRIANGRNGSCVSIAVFKKSNSSQNSQMCSCDLQVFQLNCVKCIIRIFCKISYSMLFHKNYVFVCFFYVRLFTFAVTIGVIFLSVITWSEMVMLCVLCKCEKVVPWHFCDIHLPQFIWKTSGEHKNLLAIFERFFSVSFATFITIFRFAQF